MNILNDIKKQYYKTPKNVIKQYYKIKRHKSKKKRKQLYKELKLKYAKAKSK